MMWRNVFWLCIHTVSCQDPALAKGQVPVAGGTVPEGAKGIAAALGAFRGDHGTVLACVVPEGRGWIQPPYILPLSLQPEPSNLPCFKSSSAFWPLRLPPPVGRRVGSGRHCAVSPHVLGAASGPGTLTRSLGKC